MLPEYPKLRSELEAVLRAFLRQRVRAHQGPFGKVPITRIMEGESLSIVRPGQPTQQMDLREFKTELTFRDEKLVTLRMGEVLQELEKAAIEMATKTGNHFMRTIADFTSTPDRTAEAPGPGVTPKALLAGFEKVQIDFDDRDQPLMPTLLAHPDIQEQLKEAIELLHTDPHWSKVFAKLMAKKREEWRVREANRVLVG